MNNANNQGARVVRSGTGEEDSKESKDERTASEFIMDEGSSRSHFFFSKNQPKNLVNHLIAELSSNYSPSQCRYEYVNESDWQLSVEIRKGIYLAGGP